MGVLSGRLQFLSSLYLRRVLVEVLLSILIAMAMAAVNPGALGKLTAPVKLSKEEETALGTITRGTNKFAIDLYRALSSKASGNVFVSPLCVQIVLAQAYVGAKATTANELAKLLSLPEKLDDTLASYNILIKVLQDPVLSLANRIFVENSANVKKDFQKNIEKSFFASAEALNFKNDAENARKRINSWIEDQTNKKITDLLAPGSISADTRLVLANAIHFKANWQNVFPEKNTKEQPFHVSKAKTVPVQMMNTKENFAYAHDEELGAKLLGMKYEGDNFRMVIILPDEIDGLANVEAKLANVDLAEKMKALQRSMEVKVSLPKFKLEETMTLNDILKSLGARAMFGDEANFSGITDENLAVSLVIQKSFVEVNEKGTEAAAATGMTMIALCAVIKPPPKVFSADHPFIFVIYHLASDTLVFIGRYAVP